MVPRLFLVLCSARGTFQRESFVCSGLVQLLSVRCHFTANDLYCTARSGHVLVVRDYKAAFAAPMEEREAVVAAHTILLDITTPAELLTTSKDRVVISTVCLHYLPRQ